MAGQEAWNAATFLRDTRVPISLAPKAREAMAEALRLEPHPDSKTGQKLQAKRAAQQSDACGGETLCLRLLRKRQTPE